MNKFSILRHKVVCESSFTLPLVIFTVAFVAYLNSFPGAFIQDDFSIVVDNELIRNFDVKGIFFSDYFGLGQNSGLYRPLTIFTLALNRLLLGDSPWGFHLVNVFLHACVSLLLWRLLCVWNVAVKFAWLAAVLFAVHPIHTEVVNEAVGRGELLVALFLLLALCASKSKSKAGSIVTIACYLLALLSKEHAIVFLALLPIMDIFREQPRRVWQKRWRLYSGLLIVTAFWLPWWKWGVTRIVQPDISDPVYVSLAYLPDIARILTAIKLQGLYLVKLLLPFGLQGIYSGPNFPGFVEDLWSLNGVLIVLTVIALLGLGYVGWSRKEVWALALLLYAITFFPTSNILFPIEVSFAERLAYLPSLWFCVGLSSMLASISRWQKPALYSLLIYALILGVLSVERNEAFASESLLWQTTINRNHTNVLAWVTLAGAQERTNLALAQQTFQQMLEEMPEDYAAAWHFRGLSLLRYGHFEDAFVPTLRAEQLWSEASDPRAVYSRGVLAHLALKKGDFLESLYWLDRGARFANNEDRILELRGQALAGLGRHKEAAETFSKMEIIDPGSGVSYEYGMSLLQIGRFKEAERWFKRELSEQESASAWNGLGVALANMQQSDEAINAFRQAVKLANENLNYQKNLQRALSENE